MLQETKEDVMAEWDAMAKDAYAHDVKLKNGAKELLLWLKQQDIKMAVATSNSASLFEPCLQIDIRELFPNIDSTQADAHVSQSPAYPVHRCPYRKPTQVDRKRILRPAGEG